MRTTLEASVVNLVTCPVTLTNSIRSLVIVKKSLIKSKHEWTYFMFFVNIFFSRFECSIVNIFFSRFECSLVNIFFSRFECSFVNNFFTRFECSFVNIFFTRFECSLPYWPSSTEFAPSTDPSLTLPQFQTLRNPNETYNRI